MVGLAFAKVTVVFHWGVNKTHSLLKAHVYWDGMRKDVEDYVRQCEKCKAQHHRLLRAAPLNPQPLVPLWARVHIDMMGPYPTTPNGNRFIILAVDSWSKFPEVGALPSKASRLTRNFFYSQWIARYGCCEVLYSDNGSEWQDDFAALLREHRITHQRIAPYTPHSNGQVERLVGVLLGSLRKLINENSTDWDEKVYQVAYAYRAAQQSSTRVSPALCVFGRELSTAGNRPPARQTEPMAPEAAAEDEEGGWGAEHYEALRAQQQQLEQVARKVDTNLQKAKDKHVRDYSARQHQSRPRKRVRVNEPEAATQGTQPVAASTGAQAEAPPGGLRQGQATTVAPAPVTNRLAEANPVGRSGACAGVEVRLVEDEVLPHVPDLPENTLVYRKAKRQTKLDPDREGPYFFYAWNAAGTWALVHDAEGKRFTISRSRLLVPKTREEAGEDMAGSQGGQ